MKPFLNPAQTISDLRLAVEHLIVHDWSQREDYDPTTNCYCAFGSIRAAIGGLEVGDGWMRDIDMVSLYMGQQRAVALALRDRASNAARAFYRVIGTEITIFNDAPNRTKSEVIAALTRTIEALEKDPNRA